MFLEHKYLSGTTKSLREHFLGLASENKREFELREDDIVVDIGGNDGTQMIQYQKIGLTNCWNIESATKIAQISQDSGVNTISDFFNEACARTNFEEGSVKLINASGVFFHLEELHSVIRGIKYLLKQDGVFIVQFMYAGAMIDNNNFDTIYHEHLCYYTLRSLQKLLQPYGLEVFDAYKVPIHSGTVVAKIAHTNSANMEKTERYHQTLKEDQKYTLESYLKFAETVVSKKDELRRFLRSLKANDKTIYAYGAPAKGNTLLNYFKIDKKLIDKCVEINELKVGYYLPESHIPIILESEEDLPDYYLLLSHNFATEIINKNKDVIRKGTRFIIPFPEIQVVGV
tara:strand:+ start:86 stop:1114 length:1029 start_codon:yes stop_codon:yes gene_type:complete